MSGGNMKDLAKTLRRSGLPVRRGRPKRRLMDAAVEEKGAGDSGVVEPPAPVFGESLDSWEPRYRPQPTSPPLPKEKEKVPEIQNEKADQDFVAETRTAKRMKRSKTRNMSLTVSVSEEEHQLLRRHASSLGLGFSAWARATLFRAMGRKPPARPKQE